MIAAIEFARKGGDGTTEFYACGRCGALYGLWSYGTHQRAREAAEECPQCRDRTEETRVEDAETSRLARIAKAREVHDLDFCFSEEGDTGYATPDDAREAGERGVFGSTFRPYSIDLDQLIQSILENHHEDASEKELKGLDAIESAVDHFNAIQTGGSYEMDDKVWQRLAHEETFAMIKPDATARSVEDQMLADIRAAGFEVVDERRRILTREDAEWLYREHSERDHFRDLVDYTISGEVVLLHLRSEHENTPAAFRALMGPTDRTKAPPGTLRARYAVGYRENSIHGSDSPAAAIDELAHFFRTPV